ncbi:hypothetical protein H0H93_002898, partial [Arthromyces matolae]
MGPATPLVCTGTKSLSMPRKKAVVTTITPQLSLPTDLTSKRGTQIGGTPQPSIAGPLNPEPTSFLENNEEKAKAQVQTNNALGSDLRSVTLSTEDSPIPIMINEHSNQNSNEVLDGSVSRPSARLRGGSDWTKTATDCCS